jgi:molybdopterin converting factor small subunit
MQVTVRFLGALRDQIGKQSVVVDLPAEATYRDLLDRIAIEMESSLAGWAWDATRRSFSHRTMALRNSSVQLREDSTSLADGDEIVVLVPLAGG